MPEILICSERNNSKIKQEITVIHHGTTLVVTAVQSHCTLVMHTYSENKEYQHCFSFLSNWISKS